MMNAFAMLLNSLWQAAAIAAMMRAAMQYMLRVNAATRYVIWWAVLLSVLLLPFATVMIPRNSATHSEHVASAGGAVVNPLLPEIATAAVVTFRPESSSRLPLLLLLIWCGVFLYCLARIAGSFFHLKAVKARATSWPRTLPPIGRRAKVLLSTEVSSPMAVGFLEPVVILPESLPSDLQPLELDYVVLHESAHLARFDDWTNLAARLLSAAVALHPVALWILRQIDREREIACDEWVVARTGHAHGYAASLASMCERRWSQEQAVATGLFGRHSRIVQRIELLLKPGREFSSSVSIRRIVYSCVAVLTLAAVTSRGPHLLAFAEQAQRPSFEVASIKPGNPSDRPRGIGSRGPNEFFVISQPLKQMIAYAYDIQLHQIFGGPKWIDSDLFTINAKPSGTTALVLPSDLEKLQKLQRLMLQSLMEDRFKLAIHRETRMEPIYELVVAKGGPKLKQSAGPDAKGNQGIFGGQGRWDATNQGVGALVGTLSQQLGRPVRDKTGLTGKYDYTLTYMPESRQPGADTPPPEAAPPIDSNAPSIFTALQEQLGLKLESAQGPVEVLVIDNVERPTEN